MERMSFENWYKEFNVSSNCEFKNNKIEILVGNNVKTINIQEEKQLALSSNYKKNRQFKDTFILKLQRL